MGSLPLVPLVLLSLMLALVGAIAWVTKQGLWSQLSWRGILFAALPGVLMVISFYALALHMYLCLGDWPNSIGDADFPTALWTHAQMTTSYFGAILLAAIFLWPAALLICSVVKRWRKYIAHLAIFLGVFVVCFVLMLMGPSQFLYWWWD